MREIKFRAWQREEDEDYSRMISSEQSVLTAIRHVYGGTGIATGSGFSDINNQPEPRRYELMQFTGERDKNGTEIYEGDIVSYEGVNYTIVFEAAGFTADGFYDASQDVPWGYFSEGANERSEVIGNIYENSELIGGHQ